MSYSKIEALIKATVEAVIPDVQYLHEVGSEINKQKIKKTFFVQLEPIVQSLSNISAAGENKTYQCSIAFVMQDSKDLSAGNSMHIIEECSNEATKFMRLLSKSNEIEFTGSATLTPVVRTISVYVFSGQLLRFSLINNEC